MVLTELVRLFDSSTKSTTVYIFIELLTDHRHQIVQYILLYIWDIAATAESTSGRRFCALFEYVLHYPQGNERTGDIRSSWVDVTTAAGSILDPQTLFETKMPLFSRFRRGTEYRGFIRTIFFFPQHYFK